MFVEYLKIIKCSIFFNRLLIATELSWKNFLYAFYLCDYDYTKWTVVADYDMLFFISQRISSARRSIFSDRLINEQVLITNLTLL